MKRLFIFPFIIALFMSVGQVMAQSMSDQQVLEYVKKGVSEGKDQQTLTSELARRGVTRQQAERVKKLYETQRQQMGTQTAVDKKGAATRTRQSLNDDKTKKDGKNIKEKADEEDDLSMPEMKPSVEKDAVFGRNIFNTRNLTFEPNVNLATPVNYRLGPGDEVIIDIWGASQTTIRQHISPDGTVNLDKIGPVNINGMTISNANEYLKKVLSKTYSGLNMVDGSTQIRLTLGRTRTIQVNIMGEVRFPGTYALSSFSSVFHALYRAGGVNDIGSLRSVQLVRGGKKISEIDVYEFILNGKLQDDIRLEEGDVVIVPAYESMVTFIGQIKRPMKFEMKKDETLSTLITYAGGFTSKAYTRSIRVIRQNGEEFEVNTVKNTDFSIYKMSNGDSITVDSILNRFTNKLEIRGAVYRPGVYQLSASINTVRALVKEAQGLKGDAFTNRAVLHREREDMTTEIHSLNIKAILDGAEPDVLLRKNDVLFIPSIYDLSDLGEVTILGEIVNPGEYSFSANMTLEDLIIRAGGLLEAASTVRVDVSRRIKNPKSVAYTDSIGTLYTFSLKDGFVVEGEPGFVLQPYDQVSVRRSPGYHIQQNVSVEGEILFGGSYAMTRRDERLSDLVMKAGGVTPKAYTKGARLIRKANDIEKKRMADVITTMNAQFGKQMIDSLGFKVEDTFVVGVDLEYALKNPGSTEDLVLREGDVLSIPVVNNTIRISGAVMMPNTVAYREGENVRYYLDQAGGYSLSAKKHKKFIIYMNGKIKRVGSSDKDEIEPGCEIFVPTKNKKRTTVGEILGYASSIGSLATMFATIGNLIKN